MNYKVRLFSGTPQQVEENINNWLAEQHIEIVQISPAVALAAFPTVSPMPSLTPGRGANMAEVQIQSRQLLMITIVYREVAEQ